jgi:hypothetical protein
MNFILYDICGSFFICVVCHVDQWVDSVGVFSTTTGIQVKNIVDEFSQNVKSEKWKLVMCKVKKLVFNRVFRECVTVIL